MSVPKFQVEFQGIGNQADRESQVVGSFVPVLLSNGFVFTLFAERRRVRVVVAELLGEQNSPCTPAREG